MKEKALSCAPRTVQEAVFLLEVALSLLPACNRPLSVEFPDEQLPARLAGPRPTGLQVAVIGMERVVL